MTFILRGACEGVGRSGYITEWAGRDVLLQTPMLLLHTIAGHVPHLSHEVLRITELLKLSQQQEDTSVFLSFNDPAITVRSGYNDDLGSSVFTRSGRVKVGMDSYKTLLSKFTGCAQALCDSDNPVDASSKRLERTIKRSLAFASECVRTSNKRNCNIFPTIVGGYDLNQRILCCKGLSQLTDVQGYVFDGFHSCGDVSNLPINSIISLLRSCMVSFSRIGGFSPEQMKELLPTDRLRYMPGAFNPLQIVQLMKAGIDLFDSSFATLEAGKGSAVSINTDLPFSGIFEVIEVRNVSEGLRCCLLKHLELQSNEISRYAHHFEPVVKGCECYTCSNYTCAYVNHLWATNELLSVMLLTV